MKPTTPASQSFRSSPVLPGTTHPRTHIDQKAFRARLLTLIRNLRAWSWRESRFKGISTIVVTPRPPPRGLLFQILPTQSGQAR